MTLSPYQFKGPNFTNLIELFLIIDGPLLHKYVSPREMIVQCLINIASPGYSIPYGDDLYLIWEIRSVCVKDINTMSDSL